MLIRRALLTITICLPALVMADLFQEELPPENAKPLSELLSTIEQQADFAAFEEIEFDDGVYEVEYYTKDKEEKEVEIDPVTGEMN